MKFGNLLPCSSRKGIRKRFYLDVILQTTPPSPTLTTPWSPTGVNPGAFSRYSGLFFTYKTNRIADSGVWSDPEPYQSKGWDLYPDPNNFNYELFHRTPF